MTLSHLPNLRVLGLLGGRDNMQLNEAIRTQVVNECFSRCPKLRYVVQRWKREDGMRYQYIRFWMVAQEAWNAAPGIHCEEHDMDYRLGMAWWSVYESLL